MSRSYKKAIVKDKGLKNVYWRKVRRKINEVVKKFLTSNSEDILLPLPREIMNDYDYSDYTIDYHHNKTPSYFWYNGKKQTEEHNKWVEKMKRK
jgi:hypothetical protein